MSKQEAIYREYLARWHRENPSVVQPVQIPLAEIDRLPLKHCRYQAKYNTSGPCSVFRTDDGRIVELASTTSGLPMSTATVFASEGDFLAFKKPACFVGYLELW